MYDGAEHVSIASVSDAMKTRTVVVNGFSKAYAMTGWRLGYTASSLEVSRACNAFPGAYDLLLRELRPGCGAEGLYRL